MNFKEAHSAICDKAAPAKGSSMHSRGLSDRSTKSFTFDFKAITAEGSFSGMLSPYSNVDESGDSVLPGAFTKTLAEKGNKRPLLWAHESDSPIGELILTDGPSGLWAEGKLLMTLPKAQEAYQCLKAGIVTGLSIGYRTVQDEFQQGVRLLKQLALYEGSLVCFPCNELATITSVKSTQQDAIRAALHELKTGVLCALKGNN
jgi:HK97 family phage prohead protease